MPVSHAVFGQLAAKGRELHDELLDSIQRRGHTYVQLPEIAPRYITNLSPPDWAAIASIQHAMLQEAGHPDDGYVFADVRNTPVVSARPCYGNYVHKDGRAILCMFNFASDDLLLGTPARMYWPDLMAVAFSRVMAAYGGDSRALEAV